MKKLFTAFILMVAIGQQLFAQQDAMFTKYMFNSLVYNPAYAGSRGHMDIALLHRQQWWGIDGAPITQSFTLHTPLKNERLALGVSAFNDKIGPTNQLGADLAYAYLIPLGDKMKLSVGLQGGLVNWRADWDKLKVQSINDPVYGSDMKPSYWLPNFGAGLFLFNPERFYFGVSVPHILENELRKSGSEPMQGRMATQYRHYFATGGLIVPLSPSGNVVFRPSFLIKNVGLFAPKDDVTGTAVVGAPTEFDIDASLMFMKTLWVGAAFRSAIEKFNDKSSFDSVDFWAQFQLKNGLRIGAAFDYTLTKLRQPAQGSYEIMLGYEFQYEKSAIVTPRYF